MGKLITNKIQQLAKMVASTVAYNDLQDRQIGLGIATVVLGVLAGIVLQYTRRVRNMPSYFVANYSFFRDRHPRLPLVAAILYYLILAVPCILLIVWVIILGVNVGANPALPVLFVGLFVIFIFIPSQSKLFYFKTLAMFCAYIIAEMLMLGLVFDRNNPNSFWALTALCLTINSILVIVCQWFIENTTWNIPENTPFNLLQKIRAVVKIWKQQQTPPEIIDGGIYGKVANLSFTIRFVIIAVIYFFSLVVLAIYSTIGVYRTLHNFQGLVNSVAVVTTDVITFMLIFISKERGFNPNINAIVVIAIRVCIIAFSGQFWFFGYCLLYLILMAYCSAMIVDKFYPTYEKPPSTQVSRTNIFKMPQAPFFVLILMFSALVYYMGQDGGKTLPVFQAHISGHVYPFWAVGVAAILLSFAAFFYIITLRIVARSQAKVRSIHAYYLGCDNCGQYYVFLFASYAFVVILGCYLFTVVGNHIIWASCVFLPLFYQAFVVFFLNWRQNDYLLMGDVAVFNKKLKKRKQRQDKINIMRNSVINKMKQQNKDDPELAVLDASNMRIMDNAQVESNIILDNTDTQEVYQQWREQMSVLQAIRGNKMLPTDKRVLISIPIMIGTLIGYSLAFFYSQNRDMTAFTVSVEILVLFLIFIPTKRYFSTFQKPLIPQIVMFASGLALNYAFGVISYVVGWNSSPAYTVLWTVVNPFLVLTYAAFSFVRDKGLILPSIILSVASMVFSFGPGIILLAWFMSIPVGIALIAAGFFFTYFATTYLIYLRMNNSVPFILYPITIVLIVGSCCAVMIYSWTSDTFDDFYGFSITYLVINLLGIIYASYRMGYDILNRADKPNFYSPYGMPIYKYDFNIHSAVQNVKPMQFWLASWFMFYAYTVLMQIFMADTNYGTSTSMIPLIVFAMTFIEILTYNLYRAGKIKGDITEELLNSSWQQVQKVRDRSLGNFLNLDELQQQLQQAKAKKDAGQQIIKAKPLKIAPKQVEKQNQHQNTATKIDVKPDRSQQMVDLDINNYIYDIQVKIEKAVENDKILLVNYWTNIIFKTESLRKKRMLVFLNFIRDCGDLLAQAGIALVINDSLYDTEHVYNQAFQQLQTLSPLQKVFFNKQLKLYQQRKVNEQKEKDEVHRRQTQNDLKRQKQLQNRILNDKNDINKQGQDPNVPIQKMSDGPAKLKKLKQMIKDTYSDVVFKTNNDVVPTQVRNMVKGWKRPSKNAYVMKNQINAGMQVRQGMIGNCYLISAIGVLGKDRIRGIISDPSQCPPGAYMVKFNKFNKDIYVIIDDNFPVGQTTQDNQWIFGRCEDDKQLFCNIIEKAYAKLYGGYNNIVGGKVALALADMTGGFPQQIQLKPYQQTNTSELFEKMLQFQKAGYLMGAGSPPNAKGDAVQVDGIFQGHAYLIMDVRNLDGNKLIKLRNPHGNESQESTLDWSDDSPKWTNRLKGLVGEQMGADGAFWMGLDDFVYVYRALYVCRIFDASWTRVGPFFGAWKGESAAGLKSTSGAAVLSKNPHYGIKVNKACTLFIQLTQNQVQQGRAKNKIFFMVQRNGGKRIDAPSTNKMVGMSGAAINSKTISKQINLTADSFPYTFSMLVAIYETGFQGSFSLSMYCNDKSIQIIQDAAFDR